MKLGFFKQTANDMGNQLAAIYSEISTFLHKRFLDPKESLKDDLCLDSLDIVELIVHLEKKYLIEFDGENMPKIETVEDLAQHTFSLIAARC